ncbi:AraC family transcriptional regulator [Phytohabitans sp. ZYX-F-186]|uniref:AraC family transcriptional regulator n=1 Tax=Phytohabitans maris TaxID=3071409 RepID=A0ABU0ZS70_9ACTN|nr:AraC family transcriptional regulator [Phytohabitans sp. ZYX-F-186]MDQ7909869.1 AraC family transcriptional regulator [Phytohabitans sp. ZYX-F-186]
MIPNEIRSLVARHARADMRTAIDGVLIVRADRPYPPTPTTYGKVFALIAQGTKRCAVGDRVFDYGPGQYLLTSVELPVTSYFTKASPEAPGLGVGMAMDPALVAEMLLVGKHGGQTDTGPQPGIAVSEASTDLLDAVLRLLRLLDRPADIDALAPLVKREIVWHLITGPQGEVLRQLGLPDSSFSQIAMAVRWIRDHYSERFHVKDLARRAGMSVSAFHRNFLAVTALSPIQFQKQIRLQQARLQLAVDPNDVTGVSQRVGYESPSQFSREYRRQFGTSPSQDGQRLVSANRAPVGDASATHDAG